MSIEAIDMNSIDELALAKIDELEPKTIGWLLISIMAAKQEPLSLGFFYGSLEQYNSVKKELASYHLETAMSSLSINDIQAGRYHIHLALELDYHCAFKQTLTPIVAAELTEDGEQIPHTISIVRDKDRVDALNIILDEERKSYDQELETGIGIDSVTLYNNIWNAMEVRGYQIPPIPPKDPSR